ncbi:sensor histidine kinase [Jiangella asiatica]|uniref:histidine kinase n=1 Tax=Jiangella asiatica TaxID=2530372 RepID=A0A4R5D995_9ACTN|nr:sensor histidine kinase [Jiangella asiatica]TDE10162.1 sensor histidine kinase [Jiangella asiatica]
MARIGEAVRRLAERSKDLPAAAVDAAIAVACWSYVMFDAGVDGTFAWWVPLAGALNCLPLLWRRRFPFAVAGITGITTTWLSMVNVLSDVPAAQLVATYTFAALSPPVKRLIAVVLTIIGISVSILLPRDEALNLGVIGIMFAAAYVLGTSARARRDRIAMLEERALRLTREQETAATRERQRIAREMHDILAHSMSLVAIQAEAGPVVVRSDPDKAAQMFDTIAATSRDALAQLRRSLGVLRSAAETDREPQPGIEALPGLVERVRAAGVDATLRQEGEPRRLPPDLAATVYRLVQESLTNTVRHAGASRVDVRLAWTAGALRLEVTDDGRGPGQAPASGALPPSTSANLSRDGGGHGLVGMRERVAAVGGGLDIGPGPGGTGFRVAATVPLD